MIVFEACLIYLLEIYLIIGVDDRSLLFSVAGFFVVLSMICNPVKEYNCEIAKALFLRLVWEFG